jgi:hypothetical protein
VRYRLPCHEKVAAGCERLAGLPSAFTVNETSEIEGSEAEGLDQAADRLLCLSVDAGDQRQARVVPWFWPRSELRHRDRVERLKKCMRPAAVSTQDPLKPRFGTGRRAYTFMPAAEAAGKLRC